jgi:hypothetical protein
VLQANDLQRRFFQFCAQVCIICAQNAAEKGDENMVRRIRSGRSAAASAPDCSAARREIRPLLLLGIALPVDSYLEFRHWRELAPPVLN